MAEQTCNLYSAENKWLWLLHQKLKFEIFHLALRWYLKLISVKNDFVSFTGFHCYS